MNRVMITKLIPPRIGGDMIRRPRLLSFLSGNEPPRIILLTAPAGYGKTITALQYLEANSDPFVWYQLDSYDNDPAVFIEHLIAGIGRQFPGFGDQTLQALLNSQGFAASRLVVVSLVNEMATLLEPGMILVLDDYHLITSASVHQLVQEIMDNLPPGIRLTIVSRSLPSLNFNRHRVTGQLLELERDLLRFTADEAKAFLIQRQIQLPRKTLESLVEKTDGWPVAFRMLSLSGVEEGSAVELHNMDHLYRYLATEILANQPEEIRRFLISTAVLETITPETCNQLLEREDSQPILDTLEKQQLLITCLDGRNKMYRYHHLFREFLLKQLGSDRTPLLSKAGWIAAQNLEWDLAIRCFKASGRVAELSRLLITAGQEAFMQGRWQTVDRWLGIIGREQTVQNPWLSLFQAKIDLYRGKLEDAELWVEKALLGFTGGKEQSGLHEGQLLRLRILRCLGRCQESLDLLEQLEQTLSPAETEQYVEIPMEKTINYMAIGRFNEAELFLQTALAAARRCDQLQMIPRLLEGLGNVYYFKGEYIKALQFYEEGTKLSPEQILPSYYMQDSIATIYQDWGELDKACQYAQQCAEFKETTGLDESLPSTYVQLASIWIDKGDLEKAEAYYERAIRLLRNNKGEKFYLKLNLVFLARSLGWQNRWLEAREKVREAVAVEIQSDLVNSVCEMVGAVVFIRTGELETGIRMLHQAVSVLEKIGFNKALVWGYSDLAWYYLTVGKRSPALEFTRKALTLAAGMNLIQHFLTYFNTLEPMLKLALEEGVEPHFVQKLMVRLGRRALPILAALARHKNAEVRCRIITPLAEMSGEEAAAILTLLRTDRDKMVGLALKLALEDYHPSQTTKPEAVPAEENNRGERIVSPIFPELEINMFGPLRIVLEGTDITRMRWRFTKSRELLLYLAHHQQPKPIHRILADLWPQSPPEKAINSFYTTLHWLRLAIKIERSSELVRYASKICELQRGSYSTDCQRFLTLINQASSRQRPVDGADLALLERAAALYQGDYLEQADYPWALPEREHLRRLYLDTALRLARNYIPEKEYTKAAQLLEPLVGQYPLHEEVAGLLISTYAGLGHRQAVIELYRRLKHNLAEELGLEPTSEITNLYYRVCSVQ